MRTPTSVHRIAPTVTCLLLFGLAIVATGAQADHFVGRWLANETDHGILVSLTIGSSSTLTMPGIRRDGTTTVLTLDVRNLMTRGDLATFSVDLPENEGTLDLELRVAAAADSAALRVIRVDGEAADDDAPIWMVRRVRLPAVRLDPATVIVNAFRSHSVVALGEGPHGNEQGHAFRVALLRDPRFVSVVNDIVVESGSATYQDLMDRFVNGEEVSASDLRAIRENSAVATTVWDRPIVDEFFYAVRDRNRSLPREKRLRILLGDPPIDWRAITSADEYRQVLLRRDSHPADLIRREVLAKGRRALVIYGDGHLAARSERPGESLVGILETSGVRVFIITSTFADLSRFQPDVASWRTPAIALLKDTRLGAVSLETLISPLPPVDSFTSKPNIEDHYDAALWLGPPSAMTRGHLSYPRCAEPAYVDMRVGRMVLTGMPATIGDRLAQECAAAASIP